MAFLDKKITELAFVSTPGDDDRIAIVNLGVTKQTSVNKFLQSIVAATGSFIENATISGNVITFTRADGTTFNQTIVSASYADSANSSSYAVSSSAALRAVSSSFAEIATSASYALSASNAISASHAITSSYSLEALSASFAAFATSASYAVTASHALNVPETASYALTSSFSLRALSASFADFVESASYAVTASHALNVPESASYAVTASYSLEALSASFADFARSASYAVTASHALNVPDTSSFAVTASYAESASLAQRSISASRADSAESASFATTASYAQSATSVEENLTNGLGIEALTYNGSVAQQVQLDTASAHFTVGVSASQAPTLTALSASLTVTDQAISASVAALSASAATALNTVSSSAATDIIANSASIAALSGSAAAERLNYVETSSIIGGGNIIQYTKGGGGQYTNTIITGSFVKSVNGVNPDPATGNVAVAIGSVETGLSASIPATADDGDIWIVSGETGALTGSNGKAYIYSTASAQWFEISNLDQAENDARYVRKTGDTMTGQLVLPGDPTLPLGAAPRQYVDRAYISSSIDGTTLSLFTGTTPATEHSHSITNAISASYAVSASHSEFADSASYALTSSKAISASYAISASHVEFADSASYALTSSHAVTASYAVSASHVEFADSASYAVTSSHAITASYAVSASHVEFADSASYAVTSSHTITASYAITASHAESSSYALTSSHAITSSYTFTASYAETASFAHTASFITASSIYGPHFTSSVISASYAITASHILGLIDTVRADFTAQTTFAALHNMDTEDIVVQVYQEDASTGNLPVQIVPNSVTLTDLNTATVTFAVPTTGYVVISRGGFNRSGSIQDAVSASIANTVQNPLSQGLGIEAFSYDGGTAGVIVQLDTSSAHFLSSSVATSSYALTASVVTGNTYRENVAGDVRYVITHNLNEQYPVVQTYDTVTNRQLIPDFVESTGTNTLNIEYAVTFSGIVIVQK